MGEQKTLNLPAMPAKADIVAWEIETSGRDFSPRREAPL
jgi:hypothetical protein